MRLGTADLIRKIKLDPNDVALIRHSTAFTEKYVVPGFLDACTAVQEPNFKFGQDHRYWMVFTGERSTTRFVALYRMDGWETLERGMLPDDYPIDESEYGRNDFYTLERLDLLSEYEGRLTIDWRNPSGWYQQGVIDKPIISIERSKPDFRGFDDFIVGFDELDAIISDPDYYSSYYDAMSQVYAVYVITDTTSGYGIQYVGSASGADGLWGRWRDYVNAHGKVGNVLLDQWLEQHPDHIHSLQYSVLHVLDKSMHEPEDILRWEGLYKRKLGTRESGLNAN